MEEDGRWHRTVSASFLLNKLLLSHSSVVDDLSMGELVAALHASGRTDGLCMRCFALGCKKNVCFENVRMYEFVCSTGQYEQIA
jgi:hypothetical protein